MREQLVHDGPQRRETDAAGDDHDVAALGVGQRPDGPERPAKPEHVAGLGGADRLVTAPHARTVWVIAPSLPMPLTEIGASPTPNA